jgi:hypothetical protein
LQLRNVAAAGGRFSGERGVWQRRLRRLLLGECDRAAGLALTIQIVA